MEKLPFNPKRFKRKMNTYEVWHHGRMIGTTQAVSEEQAVNNVLYRLGLIGYITFAEYKTIQARLIA